MVVEVKDKGDWLSHEQRANMIDLHALGLPTFVWTPTEGLMAYPKIQDQTLLTRLELAYELEQTKAERDELRIAKEQLHTQLAQAMIQLEKSWKYHSWRRVKFGKDFRALLDWARPQLAAPGWVHEIVAKYPPDALPPA